MTKKNISAHELKLIKEQRKKKRDKIKKEKMKTEENNYYTDQKQKQELVKKEEQALEKYKKELYIDKYRDFKPILLDSSFFKY